MGAIYEAVPGRQEAMCGRRGQLSRIAVLGAERFESLGRPASQWASIDGDYIWLHCASLYAVVQYLSNTMMENQASPSSSAPCPWASLGRLGGCTA